MNCQETKERLAGRAVDSLSPEDTALIDQHLEMCPECQTMLAEVQARLGTLGQWFEHAPPADLAAKTMARIKDTQIRSGHWWVRLGRAIDEALQNFANHKPTPLTGLATTMVAAVLMISVLSPNLMRGRSSGAVIGCRSNLRVLSKALEHYANGHQGHFPNQLRDLKGDYLRSVPDCPSSGFDTYSDGYQVSSDRRHYTLCCRGLNHHEANLPPDQPDVVK